MSHPRMTVTMKHNGSRENTAHSRLNNLTLFLANLPGEGKLKARRRELVGEVRNEKESPEKEQQPPFRSPAVNSLGAEASACTP